jgi:flagellar biosynthesis/type III secretory pathway protein FliH
MLPNFFQIMSLTADLVLFLFVGAYMMKLYAREKDIEKREKKTDTEYHQVVDDALSKERKILEDATIEASQIINETEFVSQASKDSIDAALAQMKKDIQNETTAAAHNFRSSYQQELKKLTDQSLNDFQTISKELQEGLHKQVTEFHNNMLPSLEKELDEYKQSRIKQTEQSIKGIVQKVSQQVLNKSISTDDHQKLLLESLDKAKREGIFE